MHDGNGAHHRKETGLFATDQTRKAALFTIGFSEWTFQNVPFAIKKGAHQKMKLDFSRWTERGRQDFSQRTVHAALFAIDFPKRTFRDGLYTEGSTFRSMGGTPAPTKNAPNAFFSFVSSRSIPPFRLCQFSFS